MNFFKHLSTIIKHKTEVMKLCFKCGLYWRGIVHDMSKFSITEFKEGIRYYSGIESPTSVCRKKNGISYAWLHHKGRNKHHQEYWIDNDKYLLMPYKYAVESICDRIAASKIYKGKEYTNSDPLNYWNSQKAKQHKTNNIIAKFYDNVFNDLEKHGENKVLNKNYLINLYSNLPNS